MAGYCITRKNYKSRVGGKRRLLRQKMLLLAALFVRGAKMTFKVGDWRKGNFFYMWSNFKSFVGFFVDIFSNRRLLCSLAKNDIKVRYLGSYLGILWAFIQPLVTICIMWFVFSVGFKSTPVDNFPFILWLVAGMIPWFFISDAVGTAANSVVENSYLVKKVVFRVSLLPLIKILSALFIHGFFLVFLLFMFIIYGYYPTVYAIQIIYYLLATICIVTGLSFVTSAVVVFMRDFGQVVSMILQFAFWGTPIFWSINMIPASYRVILKINPFYYIIDGYRDALIYHKWFWQHPGLTLYFWLFTIAAFIVGAILFKKLKPHFADVL